MGRPCGSDRVVTYPLGLFRSRVTGFSIRVTGAPSRQTACIPGVIFMPISEALQEHPELVVSDMKKAARTNKIFVDWSQNDEHKTTISVYSLRAREHPTVSTPVTWDEVAGCAAPQDLVFTSADVLQRVERHGDLFAPLLS